jgi:GxxExxY protein
MQYSEEEINQITHKIIGCAMQIHRTLGNGFQELIYQRCMVIEMKEAGLRFEREKEMNILYKGNVVGRRRVDFFIEGLIMLEIKATETLLDVHKAQAINYLEAYDMADGLLINFGEPSLKFKRLYNNKFKTNTSWMHDEAYNQ